MENVEYINLNDLAIEVGMDKSSLLKWVKGKDDEFPYFLVRPLASKGQKTNAITLEVAEAVRKQKTEDGFTVVENQPTKPVINSDQGHYYLLQEVPKYTDKRVKLGFSENLTSRLNTHKTTLPDSKVWTLPCKGVWEQAAIDSITRVGCEKIGQEVFECDDFGLLLERAEDFFRLMPDV